MRLFFYYFLHTTVNQIRKLFRTWVFFVVGGLLVAGGLIAYVIRWYYQRLSALDSLLPENFMEFFEAGNLTPLNALELAAGAVVLGILVIQSVSAERSVSRLFLQADVNLLFASDMTPQSVLAFRLMTTIGTAIFASVYLLIMLPRLARSFSLTPYAAVSVLLAWCFTLAFSVLFKILIYEVGSVHPFFRKNLRWFIFGFLGIVGIFFYRFYKYSGNELLLLSAHRFFNAPWTRFIPVWGWIKGGLLYAFEENVPLSLCLFGLSLALIIALAAAALHIKADYYEETLSRAQRLTQFLDAVSSGNLTLVANAYHGSGRRPSGNRPSGSRVSASLFSGLRPSSTRTLPARSSQDSKNTEDGFSYGHGASVYFYKVLFNRLRFSRFGLLTKTTVTYLIAATGAGLFVRYFMDDPLPYIPALLLAAMIFFRTIISPVTEDIRKASFLLQPDPIWVKLFFSLLGGSVNCALDVFLPLIAGSIAAGFPPLSALIYLPALVTVDFFASAAGAFVDVSIPGSIGTSLKQMLQVLLLYIGLIFDGMVLMYGIVTKHEFLAFFLVAAINLLLGAVFLGFTGVWLYPSRGLLPRTPGYAPDIQGAKKAYSAVGAALAVMFLSTHLAQYALYAAFPQLTTLTLFLPIYLVGFPLFLLVNWLFTKINHSAADDHATGNHAADNHATDNHAADNHAAVDHAAANHAALDHAAVHCADSRSCPKALPLGRFLLLFPVCFFAMYSGNLLGLLLQGIMRIVIPFSLPLPATAALAVEDLPSQAFFLVIAAPLMEEFLFRRTVIERLLPYGEKAALITSALLFGLFHGSINQICYAFTLGLVFGYVYLKTRRLRYTVILHMTINGLSSLLLPVLLNLVTRSMQGASIYSAQMDSVLAAPGVIAILVYLVLLLVLSLFGAVLFAFGFRERELSGDSVKLDTALSSAGMLVFLIVSVLWALLT